MTTKVDGLSKNLRDVLLNTFTHWEKNPILSDWFGRVNQGGFLTDVVKNLSEIKYGFGGHTDLLTALRMTGPVLTKEDIKVLTDRFTQPWSDHNFWLQLERDILSFRIPVKPSNTTIENGNLVKLLDNIFEITNGISNGLNLELLMKCVESLNKLQVIPDNVFMIDTFKQIIKNELLTKTKFKTDGVVDDAVIESIKYVFNKVNDLPFSVTWEDLESLMYSTQLPNSTQEAKLSGYILMINGGGPEKPVIASQAGSL